jgi:ubiquinone/menaquinone biosynthesis C-methylase UbiE
MSSQNNEEVQLESIRSFYDTQYYKNANQIKKAPSTHLRRLAKKIGIQKDDRVLDIACGTGGWLSACDEIGAHISGIDLSTKAIETCNAILHDGKFEVSPAESLPFEDKQFDVVTCLGSLEHFINPNKAIREMIRVAKKDAVFLILVPNKDFLTRKLGLFSGTHQIDAKEDVKTLGEWGELFKESGLTVTERWKDLHILSWDWISSGKWHAIPIRAIQAITLVFWPLSWQYQVYHLCITKKD